MPFLSIHAMRSARSESFGMIGRVISPPGNCMRFTLSSRLSVTEGNLACSASKRSNSSLGM